MLHVTPVNDLQDHELESTCACQPTLEMVNGEMIFVHNAYDEREKSEPNGVASCRPKPAPANE